MLCGLNYSNQLHINSHVIGFIFLATLTLSSNISMQWFLLEKKMVFPGSLLLSSLIILWIRSDSIASFSPFWRELVLEICIHWCSSHFHCPRLSRSTSFKLQDVTSSTLKLARERPWIVYMLFLEMKMFSNFSRKGK